MSIVNKRPLHHYFFAGLSVIWLIAVAGYCGPKAYSAWRQTHWIATTGNMKTLAMSVEEYREATKHCPDARNIIDLEGKLVPKYLARMIRADQWGHDYRYEYWTDRAGLEHCALGSAGGDGIWERSSLKEYPEGLPETRPENFNADAVIIDNEWRQRPINIH